MRERRMLGRRTLLSLALCSLGASPLAAQLDLPRPKPAEPKGPADELVPPAPPKGDLAPRQQEDPLDLPRAPASTGAPSAPVEVSFAVLDGEPLATAHALFAELGALRDARLASAYGERLLALGPAAVEVARVELACSRPAALAAAARLCLLAGGAPERAAVAERLTRIVAAELPAEVALALLDELVARDPLLASPDYLAGLLAHPLPALRARAAELLEPRLSQAVLPALAPVLAGHNASARALALELVARVEDPLAWNLLASRLGDPSARLAQRAAELLAGLDGAEELLLARALPSGAPTGPLEWDRARAYALLAVVQREEAQARVLLEPEAIEALRAGLASSQPLVAGAAAVALARVGFRCSSARAGAWLDREVPHQLVRAATGAEFHADFSSLERPALRALALLTGEAFGADGEAWRRYWIEHAQGFRARRAVLELVPDAALRLSVAFPDDEGRRLELAGPARGEPERGARVLRLAPETAEHLFARLAREGVFGVERLPDALRAGMPELRVALGDEAKRFDARADWVQPLLGELRALARGELWQLHLEPAELAARGGLAREQERLAALAPAERRGEEKRLLLAALRRAQGGARDELVGALAGLYAEPGGPEAADFEPWLAVLASEATFGPRAARVCELARAAAAAGGAERAEPGARERLIALLLERFGPETGEALARLARELEPAALWTLAGDVRPRARAAAAAGLVRVEPEALRLAALLDDPDESVRVAVLAALTSAPRAELRERLLGRARDPAPAVRAAALRALAPLGGKDVQDAALEAVGDPEAAVQSAGVELLAELADPASASLFAALLARGPASPLYAGARRGLLRLGPAGVAECLRLARSASARARREGALVLAAALAPEAAEFLIALLDEAPDDPRVLAELAVLAGQDFAGEREPARAARAWWDLVVHDDPLAWLLAAAERAGVAAPGREALDGSGTREGAQFLLALAALPPPLGERALRELEQRLGHALARPPDAETRAALVRELAEAVQARYGE
jgi:hypothetical protein